MSGGGRQGPRERAGVGRGTSRAPDGSDLEPPVPGFSTGWARILNHRPIRRVGSNTTVTISISPRGPPPDASMHLRVVGRGDSPQCGGIPSPHIVCPGGFVNLVLFTVAEENSENVRLKATARAGVIMGSTDPRL